MVTRHRSTLACTDALHVEATSAWEMFCPAATYATDLTVTLAMSILFWNSLQRDWKESVAARAAPGNARDRRLATFILQALSGSDTMRREDGTLPCRTRKTESQEVPLLIGSDQQGGFIFLLLTRHIAECDGLVTSLDIIFGEIVTIVCFPRVLKRPERR